MCVCVCACACVVQQKISRARLRFSSFCLTVLMADKIILIFSIPFMCQSIRAHLNTKWREAAKELWPICWNHFSILMFWEKRIIKYKSKHIQHIIIVEYYYELSSCDVLIHIWYFELLNDFLNDAITWFRVQGRMENRRGCCFEDEESGKPLCLLFFCMELSMVLSIMEYKAGWTAT